MDVLMRGEFLVWPPLRDGRHRRRDATVVIWLDPAHPADRGGA